MSKFLSEILSCFKNLKLNFYLVSFEVYLAYRRTLLGPFWSLLTVLVTTLILSVIWSILFKIDLQTYYPKIFFSLTMWSVITFNVVEASQIFYGKYSDSLNNTSISVLNYPFRHIIHSLIIFSHNIPVIIIIFFFFNIQINKYTFLIIPSLILILANCFLISFIVALICARFRDITQLIKIIMPTGTLFTPILWDKEMLGEYKNFAYLNPFTFFIEAYQKPILGIAPGFVPYIGLVSILILLTILTIFIKNKFENRIVFWSK